MKRAFLAVFLILPMTLVSAEPANAIFGLGQCEKVKKEMQVLEKQIIEVHSKGMGYTYDQIVFKEKQTIWEPTVKTVNMIKKVIGNDPVPKIWKLGTNNPKCFTNTQNMQIKKMEKQDYKSYFMYPTTRSKYINKGECKKLMETNDWGYNANFTTDNKTQKIISKCSLGEITTTITYLIYKSIYSY